MAETNNTGTPQNNGDLKVAVNSIQRTLYVQRLYKNIAYPSDRIIPYDIDNLYPNKILEIAKRSGSTMSAIGTLSSFVVGDGFLNPAINNIPINREGQTLWDILNHISFSKAMFGGYALHFNFNFLGQIVEINPVNFDAVRWHKNLEDFVYNPDWPRRYQFKSKEKIICQFDPDEVQEQIMKYGNEFKGQILYWIPNLSDYYTTCNWDSVIDDAQFEAEAKLYSLSSIQNDYSLGGYSVIPSNFTSNKNAEDMQAELNKDKGSANAGGNRVFVGLPTEYMNNWKWFVPISRNNIDSLHTNQKKDAKFNIYAAFRQPPILNGVLPDGGMFNQESFADAFYYYNASTESERKLIEKELQKILSFSIWSNVGDLQIKAKDFVPRPKDGISQPIQQTTQTGAIQSEVNNTLTNLTGRQLQGVFRITRNYKKGELTFEQAASLLKSGFGIPDEEIQIWLTNDDQ